jgi:hypothetical protein
MPYSDSLHFSDKISYRKHFIPSYGLKDMNITIFKQFLEFSKEGTVETFYTEKNTSLSG